MFNIRKKDKAKAGFINSGATPQIFDLLQLSRKEREFRAACKRSIKSFKKWKRSNRKIENPSLEFYSRIEGMLLHRQAYDAMLFYRLLRRERISSFNRYIEKLPMHKSLFCDAS